MMLFSLISTLSVISIAIWVLATWVMIGGMVLRPHLKSIIKMQDFKSKSACIELLTWPKVLRDVLKYEKKQED